MKTTNSPVKRFTKSSATVPNQSMSVKTILERYRKGLPIMGTKSPLNYFDQEIENFKDMDLPDKEDYVLDKKQKLKEWNTRLAKNRADEAKKAKQMREAKMESLKAEDAKKSEPDSSTKNP